MKPDQFFNPARRASLAAALALFLAGCASSAGIGSGAKPLAPATLGLAGTAAAEPAVDADWWRGWGDAALTQLIEEALQNQPSLRLAQARLARAEAAVSGEAAADGPKLNASADATRQRFSATSVYPAPIGGSIRTLANAQLAGSWEIDFFGRHRAALDAALGQQRAAAAELQAARQLLAHQVATTYVALARLNAQRELLRHALAQREQMLGLIRQRVAAGLDTRVELRQGEGALPEVRQQLAQVDEQMGLARHALAALLAAPPDRCDALSPTLAALKPQALPTRVPADLLGRRADVVAARWRVEAATQGVAAAKAQFYPNVNLTAFLGLSSIGLDRLIESGSQQHGVGPAIRLPIFDGGALRANLRGRAADLDAAIESYNGAVIDAVHDSADQLGSLRANALQQAEQAQAQAAAASAYDIALMRERAGLVNRVSALSAESALINQQRSAIDLAARDLSLRLALIRALGGGYQADADSAALARR